MKFWKKTLVALVILFAIIGLAFSGVFFAMRLGLTNVRGTISERNKSFYVGTGPAPLAENASQATILCRIHALAQYAPETAKNIQVALQNSGDRMLASQMLQMAEIRFMRTSLPSDFIQCSQVIIANTEPVAQTAYAWADSDEWRVIKSAFIRDQDTIRRAAKDAGVSPRILLGGVIGEQFRFFTSARDSFKQYFEPLKILASLSKFSYGIAGLKPETVGKIDTYLNDPTSQFYPGPGLQSLITYPAGSDPEQVRFQRITDTKDTYYSYLYVGLYMRQITAQWKRAGYDISSRPDVLSTLYNLGFPRSIPKPDPTSGGAPVTVNGETYNFGQLGEQFYYSGELVQEFPYEAAQ